MKIKKLFTARLLGVLIIFTGICPAVAELQPAAVFGEGMVLQRDKPLVIWGTDAPGTAMSVSIAGLTAAGTADGDGKWRVEFPPLEAGGPHVLKIAGSTNITFHDVLVGEVWLASGQSNMQWILRRTENPEPHIASADFPQIRFFNIPRKATRGTPVIRASWQSVNPENADETPAVQFFFARDLHQALKVPVGILNTPWGGTSAQPWVPLEALNAHPRFASLAAEWDRQVEWNSAVLMLAKDRIAAWERQAKLAKEAGQEPPPKPPYPITEDHPHTPGILFNSMIRPLVPFAIRGVIWYQGESDTGQPADRYRDIFQLLIREWRNAWTAPELPFLFVQLAGFRWQDPENLNNWAELRQAQADALVLPATGMAVAIDVGDAEDIHPPNKLPVGERLALQAKSVAYGMQVAANGPSAQGAVKTDGGVVVEFRDAAGLTTVDGAAPRHFELAGGDGVWFAADAEVEGETVKVQSPAVPSAVRVRYAWSNFPDPTPNLTNSADLPAAPFSMDVD